MKSALSRSPPTSQWGTVLHSVIISLTYYEEALAEAFEKALPVAREAAAALPPGSSCTSELDELTTAFATSRAFTSLQVPKSFVDSHRMRTAPQDQVAAVASVGLKDSNFAYDTRDISPTPRLPWGLVLEVLPVEPPRTFLERCGDVFGGGSSTPPPQFVFKALHYVTRGAGPNRGIHRDDTVPTLRFRLRCASTTVGQLSLALQDRLHNPFLTIAYRHSGAPPSKLERPGPPPAWPR